MTANEMREHGDHHDQRNKKLWYAMADLRERAEREDQRQDRVLTEIKEEMVPISGEEAFRLGEMHEAARREIKKLRQQLADVRIAIDFNDCLIGECDHDMDSQCIRDAVRQAIAAEALLDWVPDDRIILAYDGQKWFARKIRLSKHDLDRDEMIYYCDEPLANDCHTLHQVANAAKWCRDE